MTLTIPRAGINAGRAARVQPTEADAAGAAVAQVGDAMLQAGARLENDRLSRENARNQVSLTKDLNDLRLRMESLGDPDQIDAEWTAGVEAVRQKYAEGLTEDGRPMVDPRNAEAFGLAVTDLASRHGFQIGLKSLQKRQSQRAATYIDYAATATQAAVGSDQDTRDTLIANGHRQIDDMVTAGVISPEQAAKRKIALGQDIDNAAAIGMVAEDPAGLIAALDAGEYSALPGETQARYRVQANAALAALEAQGRKEAEKLQSEQQKAIGQRLGEITDIAQAGRTAVDEAWLASPDVKAHPDYGKAVAAIALRDATPQIAQLPPAKLDELIAAEKNSKVTKKFQTERLEVLQDLRAKAVEQLDKDPLAHLQSVGIDVPALPVFDPADPVAFGRALADRVAFSEQIRMQGYTTERRIFDNEERATIKALAAVDQDPQTRLDLAVQLTAGLPPQNADAVAEVIDDPVFSHAGSLVTNGGARALGLEILRGQQVIAEENLILPGAQKRLDPIYESLGPVFADLPGGERVQANVMAAADALYARRGRGVVQSDQVDEDLYRQALHEVMGGIGQFDGRNAQGGVQEVRDSFTILPMGISSGQAEDALESLGMRRRQAVENQPRSGRGFEFDPAFLSEQLARVGSAGNPPVIAGQPIDRTTLDNLELQAVGDDRFIFTYRVSDDRITTLQTADGQTYEFSLRALIGEARP
ncbi:hypothetical protein KX928_23355 [Roseobacter sp. YSTF-M11]|uniref:Uncharacterized protein n=1 Tax=Roseobacter insulae TaxID=2859783 RepID=A0A9X1G1A6_9RHOB|nr:hypothetical protein [Roseobacter insulae]MBW4710738.1 hypothetical protein [Roseobacter insulae]